MKRVLSPVLGEATTSLGQGSPQAATRSPPVASGKPGIFTKILPLAGSVAIIGPPV